jgi:ubiquinone/menaquinone biosynthesis C-methylase UbiE
VEVFKARALDYDAWYVKHPSLYKSELLAAARLDCRGGVEVGVGTGRFAAPLGLRAGVDPAREMLKLAPRELDLVEGVGEMLPLRSRAFPCALLVVTLCFVQDPAAVLRETMRVAERVVTCIVPRDSPWGRRYREAAARGHPFYAKARFYTVREVVEMAGVAPSRVVATLSYGPEAAEAVEEPREASVDEAEEMGFVCLEFRSDDF